MLTSPSNLNVTRQINYRLTSLSKKTPAKNRHTLLACVQCAACGLSEAVTLHLSVLPWPVEHPAELAAVQHSSACALMQLKSN